MVKIRKTYSLEPKVVRKIQKLSDESYRLTGRHLCNTEIIELLVNKAFVDKKQELAKRLYELDRQREGLVSEIESIQEKEVKVSEW